MMNDRFIPSRNAVRWIWIVAVWGSLCGFLSAESPPPDPRLAQAQQIGRNYLAQFPEGYTVRYDPLRRLVTISGLDEVHFRQTAEGLAKFSDAFCKTLGTKRPRWLIPIVLPTAKDYESLQPDKNILGFYRPSDRTLISRDRGRVLAHEFTHALHHADCAAAKIDPPIWISEGLASLFESVQIAPAGLVPQIDGRLIKLKQAITTGQIQSLDRLVTMTPEAFMRDAEICYAQARYLLLYLDRQGKLKPWYQLTKEMHTQDASGKRALEKVLKQRLFAFQEEWKNWVQDLQLPWGERQSGQARLGLHVKDSPNGVEVVGFVPGSAAERAQRIEVGDIITKCNGQGVSKAAEFIGTIQAAGAMQTVRIELKRHGQPMTVYQPLGAPASP